ncbi:MAG: gliding motility-associated C-terminal domain-containing protein [Phaeodactylibacter sp.]|nr:gliding motility-associated C-terminal domain-containing protein [Phaeodactylibacter sp.]
MYWLRIILIALILPWAHIPTFCQAFPCDGSLLFSTNSGGPPTKIYKVYFGPFGLVTFGQIKYYSDGNFNGLGFNPKDNYIYAVRTNSNEIVRIKADNSFEVIGNVPNLDELTTTAGDCTPDGYYLCHDQVLDQILVFEVVENFALVNQIDLFWDPISNISGPFTARIDDFAIDPNNTTVAYSFQGNYSDSDLEPEETKGFLLKINLDFQSPNVGMVTPIARIPRDVIRKIGSLMFSANGGLFAYGSTSQNPNQAQNRLLNIDKSSGVAAQYTATGPGAINSDGCSCPYSLSFTNYANPNFALCSDSKLNYTLVVTNRTFQDIPNASLVDTLAEGMIISNISGNFNGNFAAGTGIGTRILQLDNIEINARSEATIQIETEIIDLPIDIISNQAFLTNLPEKFENDLVSDDPATVFVGDATRIFSDPQRLKEFTIEVTHPTDCLKPGDGRIVLSAPVLIPGIEYEVNMRNEEYTEFARNVIIDDQHTFVLDSLFPGEYTFYKITPRTSRCSFAMKDTTVTLEAPNELIQADIFTNSPICEGATLELSATVFPPEGTVQWSGPNGFLSTDLNITLDTAVFEQSGLYEMVFSYGVCEQVRKLEIEVAPDIEAKISSKDNYCERDTVRLIAEGAGNLHSFIWTNPDGIQFSNQVLEIPFAGIEHEGLYEVIIDNGYCKDTTSKFISMLPTPTLTLPSLVKSEFCNPGVLTPELSGDTNVSYAWTPGVGLSCTDCPKPEIALPVNPRYQLNVSNEFACQDSADVFVFLDQEGLIYIPNVFSPNNDGVNDYFQVFPDCGVACIDEFQIFDRFGGLVYSLSSLEQFSNPGIFWDGYINNLEASVGVYLWQLEITLIDGTTRSLKGNVTIIR